MTRSVRVTLVAVGSLALSIAASNGALASGPQRGARHHHGPTVVVIDPKTGRVVTSGSSTPGPAGTTYVQLDPATGRIVGLR